MVPNARFTELLTDIEPSPTTVTKASTAHYNLREFLRNHPKFSKYWKNDFLSGSYSRDTAIRPRTSNGEVDRPDVDIIVVTNFSMNDTPDFVLNEVYKALKNDYYVERINKRSVRIVTPNAEMDVVPVIAYGDKYLIPDRETGQWKFTNPPAHNSWSRDRNTEFNGRFKPLVKLFKWWRRENPSGKRPKGFVLEVLVARHAPRGDLHWGEAFTQLLENIHKSYAGYSKPFISDPAIPANDILSKVTDTQWQAFIEKVRVYAVTARRAQEEEDVDKATELWRRVFGDRFRASIAPAKGTSSTSKAAATAAGYTFPNANAAPNKPRGFA